MVKVIIIAAVVLAALLAWFLSANRRRQSRKDSLEYIGRSLGCDIEEFGPAQEFLAATGLPFLMETFKGLGKNLFHLKPVEDAYDLYLFDFSYVDNAGGQQEIRECTAALFDLRKDLFPAFALSTTGAEPAPLQDNFPAADARLLPVLPAGSKLYTAEAARITGVFNPVRADFLTKDPGWSVQGRANWLLLYKPGVLAAPSEYHLFRDNVRALAAKLV